MKHFTTLLILLFIAVCSGAVLQTSQPNPSSASSISLTSLNSSILNNDKASGFKILPEYSMLSKESPKHYTYLTEVLMPAVISYFRATLKLKYPLKTSLKDIINKHSLFKESYCGKELPKSFFTTDYDDDMILIVRFFETSQKLYALASGCITADEKPLRNVVANMEINIVHFKIDDPLDHDYNLRLIIHELTHVLGFDNRLYRWFLLPDGSVNEKAFREITRNGNKTNILDIEPLTSRLKKHFGCDKIEGAVLESKSNFVSNDAHFERNIFLEESMTSSPSYDSRISEFTLAVLEGTGWYEVDYSMAEPFTAGQGRGCDYYFGHCLTKDGKATFEEFCSINDGRRCSETYMGGAMCEKDSHSADCVLPQPKIDFDCRNPLAINNATSIPQAQVFGADSGSRCFMGTLVDKEQLTSTSSTTYCFKYVCQGKGSTISLDVKIGETSVRCEKKGQILVEGYGGVLDCPDPLEFCKTVEADYCPLGCIGRGVCKSGKCVCDEGFTGKDCSWPYKQDSDLIR